MGAFGYRNDLIMIYLCLLNIENNSGVVFTYEWTSSGHWQLMNSVTSPSKNKAEDYFGYSVAVTGSVLAVGAFAQGSLQF